MRALRRPAGHRGGLFWSVVAGATIFLSLEPALFLVLLALALSAVAVTWMVLLLRLLILDALDTWRKPAGHR